MLYRRWETASRSRLAGVGFKPPGAAALGNDVVVNDRETASRKGVR
jgi:hypothetical protein